MEENCIYCDSYAVFKELLTKYTMEDAFHTVLRNFESEILDEAFKDGYISAMARINEISKKAIEQVLDDCECSCDECSCE